MNIRRFFRLLGFVFASSTLSAQAQSNTLLDPQTDILLKQGDFVVTRQLFPEDYGEDRNMCVAEIMSGSNTSFRIQGYDEDIIEMEIADKRWDLQDREATVIVDIDNTKWLVKAITSSYDNLVVLYFQKDPLLSQTLMKAMSGGHNLNITTYEGGLLGAFSIKGSKAAMSAFSKCWTQLKAPGPSKDPFSD